LDEEGVVLVVFFVHVVVLHEETVFLEVLVEHLLVEHLCVVLLQLSVSEHPLLFLDLFLLFVFSYAFVRLLLLGLFLPQQCLFLDVFHSEYLRLEGLPLRTYH
jgi:hypothetical protein